MIDRADTREYVRTYLDVDEEEVPDPLIDRWLDEAVRRVVRHRKRWPFFEDTAQFQTLPGRAEYDLPLKDISYVEGPDGPLDMEEANEAGARYFRRTTVRSGKPVGFSTWANKIRLWPQPDSNYDLAVRGFRAPVAMTADAGSTPDLPDDFEDVLVSWVMYRAYLQQDETELAAAQKMAFDEGLASLTKTEFEAPSFTPIVLNGDVDTYHRRRSELGPLFFPGWD